MKSLIAAFEYLTIWGRVSTNAAPPETIGKAAIYYPLIGLSLGLLLAFINYSLAVYLDGEILSVFLIAVLVVATGATHIEGAIRTFDAFHSERSSPTHSHANIFGFVAIFFLLSFKISAIDVIEDKIALSLLLTPVFGRWTLVLFIYGYHDRCEEMPRRIAENVRFWHLLVTTLATVGSAVYLLGRKGLWIALVLSLMTLMIRSLLHRRHTVLTLDNFGAIVEISETLSLLLLASL
ncbi:MAG TPA: adenosylcobinamide-GDP ribazoletransferase [Candidatus Binatus sp.]|nr:adenosylcobinamide-GDP ribazoletransferase [Candidatus Binatus sp.]